VQPQQHDDPMTDVRQQLLQGLSVLATVGEAGARMAAVGIQQRAARTEEAARKDRANNAAQAQAERKAQQLAAAVRDERERLARSLDGSWLTEKATFVEAAAIWRTAAAHAAAGDPLAGEAVRLAQDRIRQIHRPFMDTYDRLRAAGQTTEEAMRSAAFQIWEAEASQRRSTARPHGTREPEEPVPLPSRVNLHALAIGTGNVNDLEAAVRTEAAKLAEHVSPEALDRLQRTYRSGGRAVAADAVELLRQYAKDAAAAGLMPDVVADSMSRKLAAHAAEARAAAADASGPADLPDTARDEHTDGQVDSVVEGGEAGHDQAGAEAQRARWGRAFPPLTVGMPAELATKNPANGPAATPRRGR